MRKFSYFTIKALCYLLNISARSDNNKPLEALNYLIISIRYFKKKFPLVVFSYCAKNSQTKDNLFRIDQTLITNL